MSYSQSSDTCLFLLNDAPVSFTAHAERGGESIMRKNKLYYSLCNDSQLKPQALACLVLSLSDQPIKFLVACLAVGMAPLRATLIKPVCGQLASGWWKGNRESKVWNIGINRFLCQNRQYQLFCVGTSVILVSSRSYIDNMVSNGITGFVKKFIYFSCSPLSSYSLLERPREEQASLISHLVIFLWVGYIVA